MKTEIAGLKISYATVNELHEKMKKALEKVEKSLTHIQVRHKNLVKQKREISKFLGVTKRRKNAEPQPAGTGAQS